LCWNDYIIIVFGEATQCVHPMVCLLFVHFARGLE
jgi:hypothetical protein